MSRLSLALCLLLTWAGLSQAQTAEMPAEVKVAVGRMATINVKWDGDDFQYIPFGDMDCFREYDPDPKVVILRLIGYTAGRYEIAAVVCKGSKMAKPVKCIVIVGNPPTPPIPPPPVDPVDPPVPPPPVNPELKELQAAYNLDLKNSPNASQHLTMLAKVYRDSIYIAAEMPQGTTFGDFWTVQANYVVKAGLKGVLPNTKGYLAKKLDATLPIKTSKVMTNDDRALVAERMAWAANLLDKVTTSGAMP